MNLKGKTWAVCPAVLHLLLELIQDMCTSLIQPLMEGCWHTLLCQLSKAGCHVMKGVFLSVGQKHGLEETFDTAALSDSLPQERESCLALPSGFSSVWGLQKYWGETTNNGNASSQNYRNQVKTRWIVQRSPVLRYICYRLSWKEIGDLTCADLD